MENRAQQQHHPRQKGQRLAVLKTLALGFGLFLFPLLTQSQDLRAVADSILEEGKLLYHIELADRHSEETFNQRFTKENIQHRLSYSDGSSIYTLFFTEKGKTVRFAFTYPGTGKPTEYEVSGEERSPTKLEKRLFKCLAKTEKRMVKDTATIKQYPNFHHRKIFLAEESGIRVFLLPNSIFKHVVPIGNDFQFQFSRNGRLKRMIQLHKKFLAIESNPELEDDEEVVSGAHAQAANFSPYIHATDVCTLLLYRPYIAWSKHVVFHDRFVSFFDLQNEALEIVPASAVDGIAP